MAGWVEEQRPYSVTETLDRLERAPLDLATDTAVAPARDADT